MKVDFNIRNFSYFFPYNIAIKGENYLNQNRITKTSYENGIYTSLISGSSNNPYTVKVNIDGKGDINNISCTCPHAKGGNRCKHMYASLMHINLVFDDDISDKSSSGFSKLISAYLLSADDISEKPVRVEPEVFFDDDNTLLFKLKIGRERMYVIKSIFETVASFEKGLHRRYGKNLDFTHSYDILDEKSRLYLELAYDIALSQENSDYYYGYSRAIKEYSLSGSYMERFLNIYSSNNIFNIQGEKYRIVKSAPIINIKISNARNRIKFSVNTGLIYLGQSRYGYFISKNDKTLYLANNGFTKDIKPIIEQISDSGYIFISKDEFPSFYNTVLRRLKKHREIFIEEDGIDIIPPQLNVQLYIDVTDNNKICAMLNFCYGDKIYDSFYDKTTNPMCDATGEKTAQRLTEKYFHSSFEKHHPYIITDESTIFDFVTNGLPELSKNMEVFVSDKFKRINVRKPTKAEVGLSVSEGLLQIDISASGYTKEELAQLLDSYRKGSRYHRFKDGSFALIDDSIREIDTLTKELNINDKAFLKENISVPMYRMIYLNGLQKDNDTLRLKRSSDFKKLIKSYNSDIADDDTSLLPDNLEHIMRDYQKYGYVWLSTLGKYHMGGILADDMGLGKTIQSIALMQNIAESAASHRQSLVICPSSLTINWQDEIKKFAPSLKVVCLTGTVAERTKLFDEIHNYDIVITSYATLLRDIAKYEDMTFAVQILDEAQNIKNHTTQSAKAVKAIKSDLRFALTGTPIENTLAELWSIFDFIMPGYLHTYGYFKKTYETPIVKKTDENAVKSLQRLTSPFILRRLKKDVLTELPDKTETVLQTEMESKQKKLYTANAAQVIGMLKGLDGQTDKIKILAMLTRLRQICCDPSLVYENYDGESAKLEQCIELVKSCVESGHKILLFSQFTSMLDIISKRLDAENITYYTLTGKTKAAERISLVNSFNDNSVNVFLISLKAGGTGLNLTGADIVIHYDPWWNLSAENQASDRVYRIGQKNNVQIYKLIVKDTIEEKIRLLQQKKADLLDTAIGGDGDIMNMSTDEIICLLD